MVFSKGLFRFGSLLASHLGLRVIWSGPLWLIHGHMYKPLTSEYTQLKAIREAMNEWTSMEVIRKEIEREWECYQNFCINHGNWWDVHQCVWALVTPRGLSVTHHHQEQVLASLTAHSSSGCSSANICFLSVNHVCIYNQRWSSLHRAKEINVSGRETNPERDITYSPRFMLCCCCLPQANFHAWDLKKQKDFKFKIGG